MVLRASLLLVVVLQACGRGEEQRSRRDVEQPLKPWRIEYHVGGGVVASDSRVTLSDDANVVVEHSPGALRATFRASARQMTEAEALLRTLHLSGVPSGEPRGCGGELYMSLQVTYGGQTYPIDVCTAKAGSAVAQLTELLGTMLADGLERARVAEHATHASTTSKAMTL